MAEVFCVVETTTRKLGISWYLFILLHKRRQNAQDDKFYTFLNQQLHKLPQIISRHPKL